jgi:WD40 repeat protein
MRQTLQASWHPAASTGRVILVVLSCATLALAQGSTGEKFSSSQNLEKPVLVPQQGHAFEVVVSAISPDGRYVATGSADGEVILWETATGLERRRIAGPASLSSMAFSPNGQQLIVGGADARIWSLAHMRPDPDITFTTNSHVNAVLFLADGRLALTGGHGLQLWDMEGRKLRSVGQNTLIQTVAVSPDGNYALAAESTSAYLFDLRTGTQIRQFDAAAPLTSVAFSPDGKFIATGSKGIGVWDVEGRPIQLIESDQVQSVAFSPDGRYILASGADATIWDVATKRITLRIPQLEPSSGVFSPDGRSVLLTQWEGASLYDVSTGRKLGSFLESLESFGMSLCHQTIATFSPLVTMLVSGMQVRGER